VPDGIWKPATIVDFYPSIPKWSGPPGSFVALERLSDVASKLLAEICSRESSDETTILSVERLLDQELGDSFNRSGSAIINGIAMTKDNLETITWDRETNELDYTWTAGSDATCSNVDLLETEFRSTSVSGRVSYCLWHHQLTLYLRNSA